MCSSGPIGDSHFGSQPGRPTSFDSCAVRGCDPRSQRYEGPRSECEPVSVALRWTVTHVRRAIPTTYEHDGSHRWVCRLFTACSYPHIHPALAATAPPLPRELKRKLLRRKIAILGSDLGKVDGLRTVTLDADELAAICGKSAKSSSGLIAHSTLLTSQSQAGYAW